MSKRNIPVLAVALALTLGLCPSRADDHPFGIMPREQHVRVASVADLHTWHLRFHSLPEFINALRQPDFETLGSGETDLVYYVFFRAKHDILIFAYSFKKEEKKNGSEDLTGPGGSHAMFDNANLLLDVELLKTYVETASSTATSSLLFSGTLTQREGIGGSFWGEATKIKHGYTGPLTLSLELWTEGKDKVRSKAAPTINWKSTP